MRDCSMRHFLISFLGIGMALAHAEPSIVELVAKSDWASITVWAVIDRGRPGVQMPEPIYLRQSDGNYKIDRIKKDESGRDYYSRGTVLLLPDFQKFISALSSFYTKASKDETLSEYLAKLPDDIRRKEFHSHDNRIGRPFANFGGTYIIFSYRASDGQEADIWEEFSDPTAFEDFLGWMRSIPSE